MTGARSLLITSRTAFGLFWLATSFYALLASVPFIYNNFLQFTHPLWVVWLERYHALLLLPAVALVGATLAKDLCEPSRRGRALSFLGFHTAVILALALHPMLTRLGSDEASFRWSLAGFVPIAWLGVIDLRATASRLRWSGDGVVDDARLFGAAVGAAFFVSLLHFGIATARDALADSIAGERALLLGWSGLSHLVVFSAAFAAFSLVRGLARLARNAPFAEFFLVEVALGALAATAAGGLVLTSLSVESRHAFQYAGAVGLAFAISTAGLASRLAEGSPVEDGLRLALSPFAVGARFGLATRALVWGALGAAVAVFELRVASIDWNFVIQELVASLCWLFAFASFLGRPAAAARSRERLLPLLALAVLVLGGYKLLDPGTSSGGIQGESFRGMVERYGGYDASFRLVRNLLTPARDDGTFYRFLERNTNIPRTVEIAPVAVDLVERIEPTPGEKPDVFVFMIDSLRRDYLSAYNPAVTFTPAIDAFAHQSFVFENAFTRYGATGLSEPSIWVGGMLVHKQYVTPFHPMNALAKLLEANGYETYVGMEPILRVIVSESPGVVDVDAGTDESRFCGTVERLETALGSRRSDRPIFFYAQPQDIHVSVINREGRSVPKGEKYPGFDAPYASRLRRIDACFGAFVEFLRRRGTFERTIIILASDHGDSLGEGGRWGHAYTIYPEILKVPLIVHLPESLGASVAWSPKTIAFLTDLTPSLYYLLGHRPIVANEIFGRPLFTESLDEQAPYLRSDYLVASSYGAVYGILANNGTTLYISDGVNFLYVFLNLGNDPGGQSLIVSPSMRSRYRERIRASILAIDRFYRFNPETGR